jgi:hypothetical protein
LIDSNQWRSRIFLIFLTTLVSLYGFTYLIRTRIDPMHRDDYQEMARYVLTRAKEGDLIYSSSPAINYYAEKLRLSPKAHFINDLKRLSPQDVEKINRIWITGGTPTNSPHFEELLQIMRGIYFVPELKFIDFGGEDNCTGLNVFKRLDKKI